MMNLTPSLHDCELLDLQDPLRSLRDQFELPPGLVYLDGNSLGVLPKNTAARVAHALTHEWGQDLIQSWNKAGWFAMPLAVGDKIARLIGAGAGEVVAADSTSINLFKVLSAAIHIAQADAPQRTKVVSERSNFPTDLYIAEALCQQHGLELVLVETEDIAAALTADVTVLMLTHVNYRTGAMHDMAAVTAACMPAMPAPTTATLRAWGAGSSRSSSSLAWAKRGLLSQPMWRLLLMVFQQVLQETQ